MALSTSMSRKEVSLPDTCAIVFMTAFCINLFLEPSPEFQRKKKKIVVFIDEVGKKWTAYCLENEVRERLNVNLPL